ncbi:MAG: hypothetical protein ACRC1H_12885, partial [Caldilineaceae bacterium]
LQEVEALRPDLEGLFPLLTPEERFADVGATIETALAARPEGGVFLTKPMPGLEVKFALAPANEPLTRVVGPAADAAPPIALEQAYGPLLLEGVEWTPTAAPNGPGVTLRLYWQVREPLPADYTTTTQLFDADGNRIAQNDAAPGGVYYPTSLWKPGERLVETHLLPLAEGAAPASLLVGMYSGPDLTPLAPPLNLALAGLLPE